MRILILLLLSLCLMGCGDKVWGPVLEVAPPNAVMGRYDVTVSPGRLLDNPNLADGDIEIDIIALTNDQYCIQGWFKHDLVEYFDTEGDTLRDTAPVWRAKFQPGDEASILKADDPHWALWEAENATHLIIIAEATGDGKKGSKDEARRIVLPLDRSRWLDDAIELRLMSSGLVLKTRRLPVWPGQPRKRFRRY